MSIDVEGRGAIRSDTVFTHSAPRSFAAETPAGTSMASVASLMRELGSTDRVRLAFSFYVVPPPADVGDSFATIRVLAFGTLDMIWFKSSGMRSTERMSGQPNIDHDALNPIAPNTWVRVQVEVTPGHIVATLDGVTVIDATTTRTYSGAASVSLGLSSNDPYAIGFRYDDVLVDTSF